MGMKGKWAQGIQPRNFAWVIKGKLAVCERPGGYGANHRRPPAGGDHLDPRAGLHLRGVDHPGAAQPAQLHRARRHLAPPALRGPRRARPYLRDLYTELRQLIAEGQKVLLHGEELGDRLGIVAGYIVWTGMVPDGPKPPRWSSGWCIARSVRPVVSSWASRSSSSHLTPAAT